MKPRTGFYHLFTLLILGCVSPAVRADDDHQCCRCGKKICVLSVSREQKEVTCFEVECQEICIPGIKLPWDKCGPRRWGGVKTIRVLTEESQDTEVCQYDWSLKTVCSSCSQQHDCQQGQQQVSKLADQTKHGLFGLFWECFSKR
jgi:hypothetical protein